jgi:hypothetical protein
MEQLSLVMETDGSMREEDKEELVGLASCANSHGWPTTVVLKAEWPQAVKMKRLW